MAEKEISVRAYLRKGKLVKSYVRSQEELKEEDKVPPPKEKIPANKEQQFKQEAPVAAKKPAEFAPGISRTKPVRDLPTLEKPVKRMFGLQLHDAVRAGRHYDLRIGDMGSGVAYSWAVPKARMPVPGDKVLAVRTFDHSTDYMPFQGKITERYGMGTVKRVAYEPTELTYMSPEKIRFNLYRGQGPEEFLMNRVGAKLWLLRNTTVTRLRHPEIPDFKPTYKEVHFSDVDVNRSDEILQPKIDGAHVIIHLRKAGEHPRVYSHRPAKNRAHDLIEHTHKFESLFKRKVPKELEGLILRGEAFVQVNGKARDAEITTGTLNSAVWGSREKQKFMGNLALKIYDVQSFKDRDLSGIPYGEKLDLLKRVQKEIPSLEVPEIAVTPDEKTKMLRRIEGGTHPDTNEGVVAWNLSGGPAVKAKRKPDFDVYIRKINSGAGKYEDTAAGSFSYSLTPTGPVVGNVGSGFSDKLRKDMLENPKKYVGKLATVRAQKQYKSGALHSASFFRMHPEG